MLNIIIGIIIIIMILVMLIRKKERVQSWLHEKYKSESVYRK